MSAVRRFHGRITGVGSTSGVRVVVGRWHDTPMGEFADAMVETAAGHRVLVAPTAEVADVIATTYTFDEVRVEPVTTTDLAPGTWRLSSPSLELQVATGRRTPLGWLLHLLPARVLASPTTARLTDPVARLVLRGVRTRGSARGGRVESYGATDVHAVTALRGRFDGRPLGALAPVDPPCRFGFSSTPRRPSTTAVVTTVEEPRAAARQG